jgi:hypothetical protein
VSCARQSGYGAFSVGALDVERIIGYIENQKEHHRKVSFQDEYRDLLRRSGIDFDEQYVWDCRVIVRPDGALGQSTANHPRLRPRL